MPTTTLPQSKERAHEITRKIANERPLNKDRHASENQVTGGFNQKAHQEVADESQRRKSGADPDANSATEGDGE